MAKATTRDEVDGEVVEAEVVEAAVGMIDIVVVHPSMQLLAIAAYALTDYPVEVIMSNKPTNLGVLQLELQNGMTKRQEKLLPKPMRAVQAGTIPVLIQSPVAGTAVLPPLWMAPISQRILKVLLPPTLLLLPSLNRQQSPSQKTTASPIPNIWPSKRRRSSNWAAEYLKRASQTKGARLTRNGMPPSPYPRKKKPSISQAKARRRSSRRRVKRRTCWMSTCATSSHLPVIGATVAAEAVAEDEATSVAETEGVAVDVGTDTEDVAMATFVADTAGGAAAAKATTSTSRTRTRFPASVARKEPIYPRRPAGLAGLATLARGSRERGEERIIEQGRDDLVLFSLFTEREFFDGFRAYVI